jgi:hypothetical protein
LFVIQNQSLLAQQGITLAAEQLGVTEKVRLIAQRAFRKLLSNSPPLPGTKLISATGRLTQLPFL